MMGSLVLLMFPLLVVVLLLGVHVAFAMMGVALLFGYLGIEDATIFLFREKIDSVTENFILAAVPLFIFMGAILERAGIAEKLFDAVNMWTRNWHGGLAISTVVLCAVFAATAGVVGATEAVVGLLAIPVMLRYKYDHKLISGTICAGGSLGTVIPPSITVIVLGPVADVPVGQLFAGMLIPGIVLAFSYILYIVISCKLDPSKAPAGEDDHLEIPLSTKLSVTFKALIPPMLLIFAVLGTILFGIAAPTEAGALGVLAAVGLAMAHKSLDFACFQDSLKKTLKITCMILLIVLGGSMFAAAFASNGGLAVAQDLLLSNGLNRWAVLFFILLVAFLGGFFLDWISIILIVIPIAVPIIGTLGFDPVWFCVLFLIVIQTSYLTPPLAPAVFYLKGIAPPEIKLSDMYRGVIPFILLHFGVMILLILFPSLVTALAHIVP